MGEDDSGLHSIYLRRGAGYHIEVGASQMIIDGRIRLKRAHFPNGVAELGERSVVLSDGTTLPADLVVFATGYGNMSEWAAKLISPEVAARVGPVWGLGAPRTIRGRGRASCATCGSLRRSRDYGFTGGI